MKFKVIWHDCEDERTGNDFEVEGKTPKEAYFKAEDYIKSLSPYLQDHYWGLDIECLVDEQGKYHHPDFFLNDEAVRKYEIFCEERKIKNRFEYNPSMGIYHPSSELVTILKELSYISERIPTTEGEREILIKGYLPLFSPAEWHITHYDVYNGGLAIARGKNQIASSTKPHLTTRSSVTVSEMIIECLSCGANITHIIREEERRNKDFNRTAFKMEVYQFEPDGERIVKEIAIEKYKSYLQQKSLSEESLSEDKGPGGGGGDDY